MTAPTYRYKVTVTGRFDSTSDRVEYETAYNAGDAAAQVTLRLAAATKWDANTHAWLPTSYVTKVEPAGVVTTEGSTNG